MEEETLSLKYRPKSLAEVIGQRVVTTSYTNAFKYKTLHPGYIHAGKLGTGKTSVARIVAAMENCEKGPTLVTCGVCRNCVEIFKGVSLDVKEIDAATNRGINEMRAVASEIRYNPVNCRMKYVIIDEVQKLTNDAGASSLKMIEEPPPGVRFILATTDPHMILDTIRSRCITMKFHKVSWAELTAHLTKIAAAEKLDVEEDALKVAARSADYSVRNSLVNLQKLINFAGKSKITALDAKEVLNVIDEKYFFAFVDAILNVNTPQGMLTIEDMLRDGSNANEIVTALYHHLRNLMIVKTCGKDLSAFGFTEEDTKRYEHQATSIGLELVMEMMNMLSEVNGGLRLNLDPQILLEKYMIQCIIFNKKAEAKKKIAAKK